MRSEKEIRDKLLDVRIKVYRNSSDVYVWEKVQSILEWVLSGEDKCST